MKKIKILISMVLISISMLNCAPDDNANFGNIITPSNLQVTAIVADDQSGLVTITPTAENALSFQVIFTPQSTPALVLPGEQATFRFTRAGQFTAVITVVAFGTGGSATSKSIEVELDVKVQIDPQVLQFLAGNGSKKWVWDQTVAGHFGVGDVNTDFPGFFSAAPNSLNPCLYDDVLTFSFDAQQNLIYEIDTKGSTFMNWTEVTKFFPDAPVQQFVDECRNIDEFIRTNTAFSVITDALTNAKTLTIDNSVLSYDAGITEFQILELTANKLSVRGIQNVRSQFGGGQLAWYFTFVPEGGVQPPSQFNNLVWSDEFNVDGAPNSQNWNFDTGTGVNGWGNNELQYYTNRPENIVVQGGLLKITAKRENFSGSNFTSARINSKGKFDFKYGKIEMRAKLPTGGGTWPAFWALGADIDTNPWPGAGEIDFMEHVGNQQDRIFSTLHFPGNSGGGGVSQSTVIAGASNDFHVYAAEWTETQIKFFVDNQLYHTFANSPSVPFNKNFFLLINFAMGGNFGGAVDGAFTQSTYEIDYVKVFQ
ncbi:MAG: glycoside hydrolase family 16 protein [Flavobacteriaceae bacterium]|nr:glycoside hydrolase family 16 protein [Flavobacteriaceae bacterium]MDZ4148210.1 glycoside hydrolase family 16 protein [Flavobacteriaceae bacterium]